MKTTKLLIGLTRMSGPGVLPVSALGSLQILRRAAFGLMFGSALFARAAGPASESAPAPVLFQHAKLQPPAMTAVRWTTGFWADRFDLCHRRALPSMRQALLDPDNSARLSNFRVGAGLEQGPHAGVNWSDGDCYKWIEAMAWVFAMSRDPALDREMDEWIDLIARTQAPDGYLCTQIQLNPAKQRWEKRHHHELYNMGHLMTAASVHHAATGKTNFLAVARKLADYLQGVFGPRPEQLAHFGWNPSNIMGLVDLYRATGERRYLDLAGIFVDLRGSEPWPGGNAWSNVVTEDPHPGDQTQDRVALREETEAVGHAVTGAYLYCGATDVFAETGDRALFDALERIWQDMTQTKMYVTGAIGAYRHGLSPRFDKVHEAFGWAYDLPQRRGYNETCANLANAMWNWRLLLVTAEARYADVMERVLYNSGLSPMSLDGTRFCYCNPLVRRQGVPLENHDTAERWFTHNCYCCPPSVVRSLVRLHTWAYAWSDEGLWVNLYGGNTLDQTLPGGGRWKVTQTTDYPWNGAIRLAIEHAPANAAALHLRIPDWTEGASLKTNGNPVARALPQNSYVRLAGPWQSGDVIELNLPMPVTLIESHPRVEQTRGQVAVQRGPIIYCLESVDLPREVTLDAVLLPRDAKWTVRHQSDFLGGVTTLATDARVDPVESSSYALYRRASTAPLRVQRIQVIPYYAWNNRGPTDMSVWLPAR